MQATPTSRCAVYFLILLLLTGLIEFLFGRSLWCSCNEFVVSSWIVFSRHNSQHLIDPYTFSHVLHGFIFFGIAWLFRDRFSQCARFLMAMITEAGWEILENSDFLINRYRTATFSLDYFGDSIFNSLSDIVACALGFLVARKIPLRYTVTLILLIEIVMLATIRDNLLLNVVMLIYPIDWIRTWQAGG